MKNAGCRVTIQCKVDKKLINIFIGTIVLYAQFLWLCNIFALITSYPFISTKLPDVLNCMQCSDCAQSLLEAARYSPWIIIWVKLISPNDPTFSCFFSQFITESVYNVTLALKLKFSLKKKVPKAGNYQTNLVATVTGLVLGWTVGTVNFHLVRLLLHGWSVVQQDRATVHDKTALCLLIKHVIMHVIMFTLSGQLPQES